MTPARPVPERCACGAFLKCGYRVVDGVFLCPACARLKKWRARL